MAMLLTSFGLMLSGGMFWLAIESHHEGELRARTRSLFAGIAILAIYLIVARIEFPGSWLLAWILCAIPVAGAAALLMPTVFPVREMPGQPQEPIDERTIMFSRAAMAPGTDRFDTYYQDHPEHREPDDHFRSLPGLMSPTAGKYEPLSFTAAAASFATVEKLADLVAGEPAQNQVPVEPDTAATFLKGWARKLGTIDCGITTLQPHHLYSVKGRGPRYGQEITLDHEFAVALTVEMDHRQMASAPEGPTLMESAEQYLDSGAIAVQLAEFCRRLGWRAEAHIDANYQVVCPLVAQDAGLGVIGRMGLLMTPRLGPRVRIAVVTTDLPLAVDVPHPDLTVLHFCDLCKKCADICPPKAIPAGPPATIDGIERWQIDQEACFTYWCATGTDCGQCMRVCPYSHPDSTLHNIVRWGLRRSVLFQRFALKMDDWLYGRRPEPAAPSDWLPRRAKKGTSP